MAKDVRGEIIPAIKQLKAEYQADAWFDDVNAILDRLTEKYASPLFLSIYERIARRTISMQNAASTDDFLRSVNRSVGVDVSGMMSEQGMADYINASLMKNVDLIKTIPEQYFSGLRNTIFEGMTQGFAPSKISRDIQMRTGIQGRRARFIARDQVSKLNSDITRRRMKQTGAKYFRWSTSRDERVGSDHRKAANRITPYGKGVYRLDKGAPEGFPGNATRPNCRCVMILLIPGVNYFPGKER